ncbi:hypothetical protein BH23BAC3_BH23BAC3_18760 [soil metagenome]
MTAKPYTHILLVETNHRYILSTTHTFTTLDNSRYPGNGEIIVSSQTALPAVSRLPVSVIETDQDVIGLSILSILLINILILILS